MLKAKQKNPDQLLSPLLRLKNWNAISSWWLSYYGENLHNQNKNTPLQEKEFKFFKAKLRAAKILTETDNLYGFECRAHLFNLAIFNISTQQY